MNSLSSIFPVLLLVEVTYSLSTGIYHQKTITSAVLCDSNDIHRQIEPNERQFLEYDEYGNPVEREEEVNIDPCIHSPDGLLVEVYCPYVREAMTIGYTISNKVCPNDQIIFHFTRTSYGGFGHFEVVGNISTLHGAAFKAEFKISDLHLENMGITRIAPGAFNFQTTIKSIFLSENNLSVINVGIFNSLTHLDTLDLSENQIVNLTEDAFSSVPLSNLSLGKNKLTSLPDTLFGTRRLDLSYNNLQQINPNVNFEATYLDVTSNNISYFNMSSFPYITQLYLANNKIKEIEPNPNINRLDVHNNTISEFPENLHDLVMLNMGTNNISHLPNNSILGNNLIQLSLSQNHLTYIPVMCFKKLKALKHLDLSGNEISSFSFGTFDNLENLLYLNISDNKFKVLPIYALHSVNNLVSLSFSDNDVTDLNVDDLLKHLPSLSRVDFRGNKLPCQQLLEAVQKLNMHHAVFEKGTHVETDNIYGMKCNVDDVKDKTKLKLLPEDFMNSSFVRYLESLNGVPSTENQRILEKLLDMDKKQIEVLEKIFNKLDKSQVEILQKSLENHNTDILKQLEDTVSNTKTINDNYEELKNVLRSILATDNKRNELLDELVIEQSNKSYQKNSVSMVEQFISILNKSYERQNETYSNLSIEMKNAMEALGRTQMNLGYFIEKLVKENQTGNNLNLSFAEEGIINANRAEALQSYPMDNSSDRKYPIFVFIALLLLAMTILMSVLLYVLYYRVKYVINTKQDVELNQLLGSKSDIVSN